MEISIRPKMRETSSLLFVREISRRVLGEYSEAISALDRAADSAADLESVGAIIAARNRLRACAEAHRALQAPAEAGPQDLGDHLGRLGARLTAAELEPRGIRLKVVSQRVRLSAEQCWHVGLIVAELVRNASRHGLAGRPGQIHLDIAERCGRVRCTVRDDGQLDFTQCLGRGRRLVQAMAARLGGRVRWAFTPLGCSARLEFPAAPPEVSTVAGPAGEIS